MFTLALSVCLRISDPFPRPYMAALYQIRSPSHSVEHGAKSTHRYISRILEPQNDAVKGVSGAGVPHLDADYPFNVILHIDEYIGVVG